MSTSAGTAPLNWVNGQDGQDFQSASRLVPKPEVDSSGPAAIPRGTSGGLQDGPNRLASAFDHQLSLASRSIHADDYINSHRAVAPPLHVSTTFRYAKEPEDLVQSANFDVCPPRPRLIFPLETHTHTHTHTKAQFGFSTPNLQPHTTSTCLLADPSVPSPSPPTTLISTPATPPPTALAWRQSLARSCADPPSRMPRA
jgi:hypothetical protein